MLVIDASCLCEVVMGGPGAEAIRDRLSADVDQAAPHIIDVEVFGVIRREHLRGRLDRTEAAQGIEDLEAWPGQRFGHRPLLARAWELRDTVRGWNAMYVALAEALGGILVTTDQRLAISNRAHLPHRGDRQSVADGPTRRSARSGWFSNTARAAST